MPTESKNLNFIQIVGKSLPLMSFFLIVIGYIKTYLFFKTFNIDITNYISLSDLPFIIPPDLIILLPMMILLSIPIAYTYKESETIELFSSSETIKNLKNNKTKEEKIVQNFISVALGSLILFSIYKIISTNDYIERVTYFINIGVATIFVLLIRNVHSKYNPSKTMWIILIIVLLLIMPSLRLITNSRKVKMGFYNGTIIYTNKDTITTDEYFLYIGSTSSHVFFYNKMDESHTIIPKSEIIKLEIHQYNYPIKDGTTSLK